MLREGSAWQVSRSDDRDACPRPTTALTRARTLRQVTLTCDTGACCIAPAATIVTVDGVDDFICTKQWHEQKDCELTADQALTDAEKQALTDAEKQALTDDCVVQQEASCNSVDPDGGAAGSINVHGMMQECRLFGEECLPYPCSGKVCRAPAGSPLLGMRKEGAWESVASQ